MNNNSYHYYFTFHKSPKQIDEIHELLLGFKQKLDLNPTAILMVKLLGINM